MKTLSEQFKSQSVAIIGMCKNAGKTTVLNEIIANMPPERNLGITSIGRDGESVDVATITPKPDVYVREGTVFATADTLLKYCDTTLEVLDTSDISTALGNVVYLRARSDGNIQIAGASTVEGLKQIHERMKSFGVDCSIFDGAISRKSLSVPSLCEELVLCSGASYSPAIMKTVEDTAFVAKLFCLDTDNTDCCDSSKFVAFFRGEQFGFLNALDLKGFIKKTKGINALRVRGAVTDSVLSLILDSGIRNVKIIVDDPCKILASPDVFFKCGVRGMAFFVKEKAILRAVTVNPYSVYGKSYEREMLFDLICERLTGTGIPVFDVKGGLCS